MNVNYITIILRPSYLSVYGNLVFCNQETIYKFVVLFQCIGRIYWYRSCSFDELCACLEMFK